MLLPNGFGSAFEHTIEISCLGTYSYVDMGGSLYTFTPPTSAMPAFLISLRPIGSETVGGADTGTELVLFVLSLLFCVNSLYSLTVRRVTFFSRLLHFLPLFGHLFLVTTRRRSVTMVICRLKTFNHVINGHTLCMCLNGHVISLCGRCPNVHVRVYQVIQFRFSYRYARPFHLFRVFLFRQRRVNMVVRSSRILIIMLRHFVVHFVNFQRVLSLVMSVTCLSMGVELRPSIHLQSGLRTNFMYVRYVLVLFLLRVDSPGVGMVLQYVKRGLLTANASASRFKGIFQLRHRVRRLLPNDDVQEFRLNGRLGLRANLVDLPLHGRRATMRLFRVNVFQVLFRWYLRGNVHALNPLLHLLRFRGVAKRGASFHLSVRFLIRWYVTCLHLNNILVASSFVVIHRESGMVKAFQVSFIYFLVVFRHFSHVVLFRIRVPRGSLVTKFRQRFNNGLFRLFRHIVILLRHVVRFVFLRKGHLTRTCKQFRNIVDVSHLPSFAFLHGHVHRMVIRLQFSKVVFCGLLVLIQHLTRRARITTRYHRHRPMNGVVKAMDRHAPRRLRQLFQAIRLNVGQEGFMWSNQNNQVSHRAVIGNVVDNVRFSNYLRIRPFMRRMVRFPLVPNARLVQLQQCFRLHLLVLHPRQLQAPSRRW